MHASAVLTAVSLEGGGPPTSKAGPSNNSDCRKYRTEFLTQKCYPRHAMAASQSGYTRAQHSNNNNTIPQSHVYLRNEEMSICVENIAPCWPAQCPYVELLTHNIHWSAPAEDGPGSGTAGVLTRASNEGSRRFHNHREGPK